MTRCFFLLPYMYICVAEIHKAVHASAAYPEVTSPLASAMNALPFGRPRTNHQRKTPPEPLCSDNFSRDDVQGAGFVATNCFLLGGCPPPLQQPRSRQFRAANIVEWRYSSWNQTEPFYVKIYYFNVGILGRLQSITASKSKLALPHYEVKIVANRHPCAVAL